MLRQVAQHGQKRRQDRHLAEIRPGRLQDDGGDILVVVEDPRDPGDIVWIAQQHVVGHAIDHAAGGGAIEMVGVPAGHVVVPAVEMAAEPHQFRPARVGPRQPQRHQCGLGSGRGEAHPFG